MTERPSRTGDAGARILLGYELGSGIGYAARLRALAIDLARHGHRPVLAVRDLDVASRLVGDDDLAVVQAPYVIGRLPTEAYRTGFRPTGFADLMAINGFGSEDHLYSMVRGWRDLIDLVRPELVIGTFCPLLTTAAFGRLPTIVFGAGYSTPPADGAEFPSLGEPEARGDVQGELLATVQEVQARFGAPVPDDLTEIYRGDRRLPTTFPEIDPYRRTRTERCIGHFDRLDEPTPIAEPTVYAYLAGDGPIPRRILDGLVRRGATGSIYVRDADVATGPTNGSLSVLKAAPELEAAVRSAAIVVHHGGINTTQVALAMGRPQVLVPQVADQQLTADALAAEPFVAALGPNASAGEVAAAVEALLGDRDAQDAAMQSAVSIRDRGLHDARSHIVGAAIELLDR